LEELFEAPLSVIGNFPYNISSQIVFKILEHPNLVSEMVGMFQKEVADRIVAGPGSKTYGILSVLTAAYYQTEYLFTVEPHDFSPPPKVRSGVIRLVRREHSEDFERKYLYQVVKVAFNQRRKTLRNALKPLNLSTDFTAEPLFDKRAEQLHLTDYIQIANRLKSDGI
jgi:16S rRNA (adenine1518-N6/adenine1519-N6)-dimethyltransferase